MLFLVYPSTQPSTKHAFKVQVLGRHNPDSIHVLDQRRLSVSNIVGPTLANDVGPKKFCPSALGWPNKLGLRWPNDFCQQCLQFANKVPTHFWRKI